MERCISVDEKIRRAKEIYNRRNSSNENRNTTVNIATPKSKTKLKKMIIQILICILMYCIYYLICTTNYVFSQDIINRTKEILNKDINFGEMYNNLVNYNNEKENDIIEKKEEDETAENIDGNNVLLEETKEVQEENVIEENTLSVSEENILEESSSFNQMDIDANEIKVGCSLIKPLIGTITSRYGVRNPTTETVPKYHTGIDIAANEGTVIISAMDGIVSVVSSQGDYRKSY